MEVKFMWNGIKVDGVLYRGHYSKGNYTEASGIPKDTITIYAKDYIAFPKIENLVIENDSDAMTDYFENDRILVYTDSNFYEQVNNAWQKQEYHFAIRFAKRSSK